MPSEKNDLYTRAGIADVGEFYRTKFVAEEVLDARYFKPLDRFDMRFARTMWVYDNVRAGSAVLDLGCGAGMLALLKRKGVSLTGVDLSSECSLAARRNGYDSTVTTELSHLPFPDESFDYVVSLDVFGHIGFEEKDAVIAEIRRVLRKDGVTMHGIECIDRSSQKAYEEMTAAELREFIEVDGHVGLEEDHEHGARFLRFFPHVAWEPRYTLCLSSEEFLKQADKYGLNFEADFLDYLRGLSFTERRAFDMAMGYVFGKVSDLNVPLPTSGLYVLLKASNVPLGPFYNEHRDRRALSSIDENLESPACLDRSNAVTFDDGWYEPNVVPPIARWMSRQGRIRFHAPGLSALSLDLTTHMPDLRDRPLVLEFLLNGDQLAVFSLVRASWLHLNLAVPAELSSQSGGKFELERSRQSHVATTTHERRNARRSRVINCGVQCRNSTMKMSVVSGRYY